MYLEAARQVGGRPDRCVAVEDSSNGLRAAAAARMTVIAVPNPHYPPDEDALALADASIGPLSELTPELVERVTRPGAGRLRRLAGLQPPAERAVTDQRDLSVGVDPVAGAQFADHPDRVLGRGPLAVGH